MAPAAMPPRMPRPIAAPRRCANASVGATVSAAATVAAAVRVVRVFIMELGSSWGRSAVRRTRVPDKRSATRVPQYCVARSILRGAICPNFGAQNAKKMNEYAYLAEFQRDKLDVARRD